MHGTRDELCKYSYTVVFEFVVQSKERLQYLFLRKRQHTALMYIFLVCHACPVVLPSYYKLKYYGIGVLTQLISDFHAAKTGSLLWSENIVEINKQISDIASQERLLTQLKQQGSVDPDIFISRSNLLAERRRELKLQKERILRSEEDHTIQQTQDLLDVLEGGPDWLDDFDEQLFSDLVEKIVVVDNEKLCFRLLNGLEVTEKIERTQR